MSYLLCNEVYARLAVTSPLNEVMPTSCDTRTHLPPPVKQTTALQVSVKIKHVVKQIMSVSKSEAKN